MIEKIQLGDCVLLLNVHNEIVFMKHTTRPLIIICCGAEYCDNELQEIWLVLEYSEKNHIYKVYNSDSQYTLQTLFDGAKNKYLSLHDPNNGNLNNLILTTFEKIDKFPTGIHIDLRSTQDITTIV